MITQTGGDEAAAQAHSFLSDRRNHEKRRRALNSYGRHQTTQLSIICLSLNKINDAPFGFVEMGRGESV